MRLLDWILVGVFVVYVIRVEWLAHRMGISFSCANKNFHAIATWMQDKDIKQLRNTKEV